MHSANIMKTRDGVNGVNPNDFPEGSAKEAGLLSKIDLRPLLSKTLEELITRGGERGQCPMSNVECPMSKGRKREYRIPNRRR